MTLTRLLTLAIFGLVSATQCFAHDQKHHKGTPTVGTIVSISADGFELKTENETLAVTFTDKTEFERGKNDVASHDLRDGMKVTVVGTKLPGGKLAAKSVLLPPEHEHDRQTDETPSAHHH